MEQSAREKNKKYGDSVVSKDWTPAASEKEAFMDVARRIRQEKGFGLEYGNYSKINSPGEKFKKEIGE